MEQNVTNHNDIYLIWQISPFSDVYVQINITAQFIVIEELVIFLINSMHICTLFSIQLKKRSFHLKLN